MALIKCSNCGEDISSNAKACIHCGKELTKSYANDINGTEKNINFFFRLARTFKIFACICAAFILFMGIASQDGLIFFSCVIASCVTVYIAFLSTPFLEWKAYMLKNLYEINKKGEK